MITYKDMAFCLRDCANRRCERNKVNIKKPIDLGWMPVDFAEFKDCAEWKEKKARSYQHAKKECC